MATQSTVGGESSVLFNLRQLMQLEHERVQSEVDAARDAAAEREHKRAAAERARLESARRAELEALRVAHERDAEVERVQREREAALLRVRLETEALERTERDRLAFAHAREVQLLRSAALRSRMAIVLAGVVVVAVGVAGVSALGSRPEPKAIRSLASADAPASALAEQARELARLRELVANLNRQTSGVQPAPAPVPAPVLKQPLVAKRKPGPSHVVAQREADVLSGFDSASNDPLSGI